MFCLDNTASKTSELTKINRNTVNYWYKKFRNLIYLKRINMRVGFRYGNILNFNVHKLILSISKNGDNIFIDYTPVEDYDGLLFFFNKSNKNIKICLNFDYQFLIYFKYSKYISLSSNTREFKLFWIFCESRLSKFNGVSKYFDLHLKECEWRWRNDNLEEELLFMIKESGFIKC
jgi:hypothetical protein